MARVGRGVKSAGDRTRSALLELPHEILRKILDEYKYTKSDLRNVRLVCHALNECTRHFVLESVHIYGVEHHGSQKQPKDLLSGTNAFEECTMQLTVGRLHHADALGYWDVTTTDPSQIRESQAVVVSIITKLRNLRTVVFDSLELHLSSRMVEAAFAHPSVENIRIRGDFSNALLQTPINLTAVATKSISIHVSPLTHVSVPQDMALLRSIVRLCPALRTLDITAYREASIKLSDILQSPTGSEASNNTAASPSTLRSLSVSPGLLVSSSCPATLRYLSHLTSLSISNWNRAQDELWPAFHNAGIQLKHLKVELGTENLTQYLLGYPGLESFETSWMYPLDASDCNHGVQKSRPASKRVLYVGLSHHRDSLVDICIRHSGRHLPGDRYRWMVRPSLEMDEWMLDMDQLVWLEQFRKLRKLEVSLWIDSDGSVVDFGSFKEFDVAANSDISKASELGYHEEVRH